MEPRGYAHAAPERVLDEVNAQVAAIEELDQETIGPASWSALGTWLRFQSP
jgi:adenylate kinase